MLFRVILYSKLKLIRGWDIPVYGKFQPRLNSDLFVIDTGSGLKLPANYYQLPVQFRIRV